MKNYLLLEIQSILAQLEDSNRFYKIINNDIVWIYDSYSHDIFPFYQELIKYSGNRRKLKQIIDNLQIDDISSLLFELTKIKFATDKPSPTDDKNEITNVMINTSHRCNLNCSYCFRNKENTSISNINQIKKSIDYIMNTFKPKAPGYVFTYSMTSESSVDQKLLEEIINLYEKLEPHFFCEKDIKIDMYKFFYNQLIKDFSLKQIDHNVSIKEIVNLLNHELSNPDLYITLGLNEKMLSETDIDEINNCRYFSNWRLFRLNRKLLEVKYSQFVYEEKFSWLTFFIFTNGTCASEEYVKLLKKAGISKLIISFDGPKDIHNYNRKFNNGLGSYDLVARNIQIFKNNGFDLSCSAVLTPFFPKPLEIALFVKSLGFTSIEMVPVRSNLENSFSEKNIKYLLEGYDELFEKIKEDLLNNEYEFIEFLKGDMIFAPILSILQKTKRLQPCEFDNQLVIDTDGHIYSCLYFCEDKTNCIGDIEKGISQIEIPLINEREPCANCWARYMCGSTCFYTTYKEKETFNSMNTVECVLKKYICKLSVELLVFMKENNINTDCLFEIL